MREISSEFRDLAAAGLSIAIALIALFVAQLATPEGYVATVVLLAIALLLFLYCRLGVHVVRTRNGLAFIYNRSTGAGESIRVLRQGGVYQSATYGAERWHDPVFAYHRAFDALFDVEGAFARRAGHPLAHVLALGGGGYAWPKHALMDHPGLFMDVVEIDPAVTRAAWRWFHLDELARSVGKVDGPVTVAAPSDDRARLKELLGMPVAPRLGLIAGDGRDFLERGGPTAYDAIVNDTFVGAVPAHRLATVEAVRAVKSRLVENGLYLLNVVSDAGTRDVRFLRDEVATVSLVFEHVHIVQASDDELGGEDNYLVIASDAAYDFPDAVPFDADFLGTPIHDHDA